MMTANSDLLKACSDGNLDAVGRALEAGANVNARDEYNNTGLNWAAMLGHLEVVKRLLEAGADIENKGSGGGLTPLVNAASHGSFAVAQLLLDYGARVTDDLISVLQTKVSILEENAEAGMVTAEGVRAWKQAFEFFVTQRLKQELPQAVPLLTSGDAFVRKNAAGGMAEAGKRGIDLTPAAPALAPLLAESDPEVRASASSALTHHRGRIADWPGVQTLLASGDTRVRLAACEALISVGGADASLTSSLATLLHDGEAEVRKMAAIAASTLPRKGVDATSLVPRMIELLADAEPEVRRSAAFAFSLWSRTGFRDYCAPALPTLRSASEQDDNDAVRHFASEVLAAFEGT